MMLAQKIDAHPSLSCSSGVATAARRAGPFKTSQHGVAGSTSMSDAWKAAVELTGASMCIAILAPDHASRRGIVFSSECCREDLANLQVERLREWIGTQLDAAGAVSVCEVDPADDVLDACQASGFSGISHLRRAVLGRVVIPSEGTFLLLLGYRSADKAAVSRLDEIARTARILAQYAVSHAVVSRRQRRLDILEGLLDELAPAMLLVDSRLTVFWANEPAEALLERKSLLHRSTGETLAASSAARTSHLRRAIQDVITQGEDRHIVVTDEDGNDVVVVLRLIAGRLSTTNNSAVLVIVLSRGSTKVASDVFLSFGLIPSEVRFVASLIETGAPAMAAQKLGLSQQTAKTYLKRIYSKLGVSSQLELANLVASTMPPLRLGSGRTASPAAFGRA